jgi:outer membrane protein TolC
MRKEAPMMRHYESKIFRTRLWMGMAVVVGLALFLKSAGPTMAQEKQLTVKPGGEVVKEQVTEQSLPPEQTNTVTLEELIAVAQNNNPALQAARKRHVAAQAVPSQARSLPDPMVMGGLRNVGFDRLTTVGKEVRSDAIVSIQQPIPFPTKLRWKGRVAEREADRVGSVADTIERRLIRQVTVAYHNLFLITKSIEVVKKDKDLLERFAKTTEARYSVGKGIQQDVFRAQVEISRLLERLSILKQQERTARARINTLLNRSPETAFGSPVEVPTGKLAFTQNDLEARALEASPKVASARWVVARSKAKLNLAKAQYHPDLNFKVAWLSREQFTDIWEGWLGLTVPIYFVGKQRYGVKEARAALEAAEQELKVARDDVIFNIADQYARAHTAQEVSTLFRTGIIPQAQLSLESSVAGYEVGAVDFLTLLDNVKSLLNDELEYYREATAFNRAIAVLEEVVGESVTAKP